MTYDISRKYRMFKLLDLNAQFRSVAEPVLLNKIVHTSRDYPRQLTSSIYSRTGELNFIVACDCWNITGDYYEGVTCPVCHSKVRSDFSPSNRLTNDAWISMPDHIPGVMHPTVYLVLARWLTYSHQKDVNYIDAIINPKIALPPDLALVVNGRGHQYFYDNFDYLMDYFMTTHKSTKKKKSVPYIRVFLQKYRHLIFCNYLPILSNFLHTITAEPGRHTKKYADKSSQYVLQAAIDLSCLEYSSARHRTSIEAEAIVHTAYKSYVQYIKGQQGIIDRLALKYSLIRQHLFGTQFHWSFRSVIVPIIGPHHYDELHLPWSIGVNLLKIHIIGRLMREHKLAYYKAFDKQANAVVQYDEDIHKIIKDLIDESPERGLPCLFNRNPSLKRGSIQKFFWTRIKTDLNDNTISQSTLCLRDMNACDPIYAVVAGSF